MGVWIPSKNYDLIFNDDAANCDDDVDDDLPSKYHCGWNRPALIMVEFCDILYFVPSQRDNDDGDDDAMGCLAVKEGVKNHNI